MSENQERTTRSQAHKKKPKKSSPNKTLWKRILLGFIALIVVVVVSLSAIFFYYASSTPEISARDLEGATETQILDKNQELITKLGGENRELISPEDVPQTLKDAVTSIEDKRFYSHNGIDLIRIAGSFLSNLRAGEITQGGSTITQQLIKLSVFSTKKEDQTYRRKVQEMVLALQIEREFSKEQILTYYLNKVYMANNVYGFGTAANYYFGKPLNELTLPQLAMLAGMPQAPNTYDPYTNPDAAKERRDLVLQMMKENNKITTQQYAEAIATPVSDGLIAEHEQVDSEDNKLIFDSFLTMVLDEVQEKTGLDPYSDGLTIETTVDSDAQKYLYNIVNTNDYIQYIDDDVQNAVVMLDSTTGAVRAINGGRKQTTLLGYNRATQNDRSTGSTMKPLIDYGPAIEYLNYSTGQTLVDQPTEYSSGMSLNNWDRQYMGAMTMRRALVLSRNTTALQTFKAVGNDNIQSFLKKLDVTIMNDGTESLVESNSIGANISPLKMAAAYAAFANNGTYSKPYTITKVTTRDGQVFNFSSEQRQAMKDSTAYMMTDMLKGTFTYGFATDIDTDGIPQAGKTGSTNYTDEQLRAMGAAGEYLNPDSWFVGYSPNYTISVWTGYDNPYEAGHGLNSTEQTYAKRIYGYLMRYASQNITTNDWERPSSVVSAAIEVGSTPLALPGPRTPSNLVSTELFVRGSIPTQQSLSYGRQLTAPTGLSANYDATRKELTVTWDNYRAESNSRNISATPNFKVTVGGQTQTVDRNRATFTNISGEQVTISLVVTVGENSSDPVTLEFKLPQTAQPTTQSETTQSGQQSNTPNSNTPEQPSTTTQERQRN